MKFDGTADLLTHGLITQASFVRKPRGSHLVQHTDKITVPQCPGWY
jgi:hypothetical protein